MRKLRKAAVVVAALGTVGLLGAGTAHADGGSSGTEFDIKQGSSCRSHDTNVDILGEVGLLNGALGSALGGEGDSGAQSTKMGSSMGCNNSFTAKDDKEDKDDKGGSEDKEDKG
ncbi:hypothetical protein AB0D04_04295 [Streptomyces sp. NPDC048483]|uniref:hypothetical protein n=1 Tax=Streptomyces sp. NPDC048483 TaxID=3154927 RepID=UPI00343538A1